MHVQKWVNNFSQAPQFFTLLSPVLKTKLWSRTCKARHSIAGLRKIWKNLVFVRTLCSRSASASPTRRPTPTTAATKTPRCRAGTDLTKPPFRPKTCRINFRKKFHPEKPDSN
jgi:hypothetical protein